MKKTIYITGIKKYQISIIKGLHKSDLVEGIDYIQGLNGDDYALIWIDEKLDIKDFKRAIGTDFIWKHRMRFYDDINEIKPKEDDQKLSEYEKTMIELAKKFKLK